MIRVLLLYNEFIPSVQFCAFLHLEYLQKKGRIFFQHSKSLAVTNKQLNSSDIIIFVRSDSYFERILSEKLKKAGKYLIYILDDDLLNVPPNISAFSHYSQKDIQNNIKTIMNHCDCLLSPSIKIIEKYGHKFKNTGVLEQPASIISNSKKKNLIKIGFAGSVDRSSEIKKILPDVIDYFHTKYGNRIEFNFIGISPIFSKEYNIKYYKFEKNYKTYRNKIIELNWDIGIAPLEDNEFNNCKHYNKFIEYSSLGIAGIYSNVTPYKEIILERETGLLSENNSKSWIEMIELYIEDSNLLDKIVKQSQLFCIDNFSIEVVSMNLLKHFKLNDYRRENKKIANINIIKFTYFLIRVRYKFLKVIRKKIYK